MVPVRPDPVCRAERVLERVHEATVVDGVEAQSVLHEVRLNPGLEGALAEVGVLTRSGQGGVEPTQRLEQRPRVQDVRGLEVRAESFDPEGPGERAEHVELRRVRKHTPLEHAPRMLPGGGEHRLNPPWHRFYVVVAEQHERGGRGMPATVAGDRRPSAFPVHRFQLERPLVGVEHCPGAVVGAVVADDNFELVGRDGLTLEGGEEPLEPVVAVAGGCDDRYEHGTKVLARSFAGAPRTVRVVEFSLSGGARS